MYLHKTPNIFQRLLPQCVWRYATDEKTLYLTFDDGPTPGVTDWILDVLRGYDAQATFFCLGRQVQENPELLHQISDQGHAVGNHSYSHPSGWTTSNTQYYNDIERAGTLISSSLYRPPYGRITPKQIQQIRQRYQIIMWDVLSGDFHNKIKPENVVSNVIKYASPGSIVVFHDSEKAKHNIKASLETILQHFSDDGYRFRAVKTLS